jgi:hypothetical protein
MRPAAYLVLLLCLFPWIAHAGLQAPPSSFLIYSRDASRALVVLAADPRYDYHKDPVTLPDGRTGLLRSLFPRTGVYTTDTWEMLWALDVYGYDHQFHPSSDLEHLLWLQPYTPWDSSMLSTPCVQLYHRDSMSGSWSYDDLLHPPNTSLFFNQNYQQGKWLEEAEINGKTAFFRSSPRMLHFYQARFPLGGGETYEIDLTTGKLRVLDKRPSIIWVYPGALIMTLIFVFFMIRLKGSFLSQ